MKKQSSRKFWYAVKEHPFPDLPCPLLCSALRVLTCPALPSPAQPSPAQSNTVQSSPVQASTFFLTLICPLPCLFYLDLTFSFIHTANYVLLWAACPDLSSDLACPLLCRPIFWSRYPISLSFAMSFSQTSSTWHILPFSPCSLVCYLFRK